MRKPNIMLDLETMGTAPGSAIIEIGACEFSSKHGITREFSEMISLEDCIQQGFAVDGSTVMWWMKQKWEARKRYLGNDSAQPILTALNRFREWLPENAIVWGNGSDFDNVILTEAYRKFGQKQPWPDFHNRCFRTLKEFHRHIKPPKREGTHHAALDDAKHQALWAIKINKETRG